MSVLRATSRQAVVVHVCDEQPGGHGADVDGGDPPRPAHSPSLACASRSSPQACPRFSLAHRWSGQTGSPSARSSVADRVVDSDSASARCACRHFTPRGSRWPAIPTDAHASAPPDSSARRSRTAKSVSIRRLVSSGSEAARSGPRGGRSTGLSGRRPVGQPGTGQPGEGRKRRAVAQPRWRDDRSREAPAAPCADPPWATRCRGRVGR